jgi:hypothetical protein
MGTEREQPPDQDIEATWSEEIEERLTEIDAGTVKLIPWEGARGTVAGDHEVHTPLSSIRILLPVTPYEQSPSRHD